MGKLKQAKPLPRLSPDAWVRIAELAEDRTVYAAARSRVYSYNPQATALVDRKELVRDVLAELLIALAYDWTIKYEDKGEIDQRKLACGTVRHCAEQLIDRFKKEDPSIQARSTKPEEMLSQIADTDTTSASHSAHLRRERNDGDPDAGNLADVVCVGDLDQLRQRVEAIPGASWEKLRKHAGRSARTQAQMRDALETLVLGAEPDVTALVAGILDLEDWAIARTAQGHNLSTVAAVADGATHSHQAAHKELTSWYVANALGAHCPTRLLIAGLLDHIPARKQHSSATNVAKGLAQIGVTAHPVCSQVCVHELGIAA